MQATGRRLLLRLSPVAAVCVVMAAWFNDVQDGGPWVIYNLLPLALLLGLSWLALRRGDGYWSGPRGIRDWRMPLGVLGFAIPALGLAGYLHYAFTVDLDGMFGAGPGELFRFLPLYNLVAGGIGFAIGWIVGRNIL